MTTRKIYLKHHNLQAPALLSLISAVTASVYTTLKDYSSCLAVTAYFFILLVGFWSVLQQHRGAKAKVVLFNKDSWQLAKENLILEIESDFMFFRVETKNDDSTYQEVMGDTRTSEDGNFTKVLFLAT